jgi:hypothetical protein
MLMDGQKQNYHIKIIAGPGHDEICHLDNLTPFFMMSHELDTELYSVQSDCVL